MRVKAFHKDVLRAITHSWSRFLALFVIVALGAGFYSGLRTTAPNMRATADAYYDDTRFFDVRLVSTFGFTDDDVEAIRATEGVGSVMAGYSADLLVRMGEKDVVTRLHSLPSDLSEDNEEYLNRPTLKEGRMPENPGECVVSVGGADDATGLAIGDTVTIEDTDGSLGDTLARSEFTVVGFVESSYYLSMSLGTSTVGSGTLGRYLYVLEDDFSQEYYTDLYLSVEGSRELDTFSGAYEELVQPVLDSLEDLADVRAEIRYGEIRDEAEETLADAEQTYEEEKAKAEKELDDAYQELLDGEQELEDAEQELLDGEQELEDAKRELEDARTELADGRQELLDGQAEYEDGVRQLEEGKADYEDGVRKLEEAKDEWSDGWSEYLTGLNEYEHNASLVEQQKEEAYEQFADARKQIQDGQKELEEARKLLAEQKGSYESAKQFLSGVEQVIAVKEAQGGGGEEGGGEEGGEGGDQAIRDDADAQEFLASLMSMTDSSGQMAAIGALDSASRSVLGAYINALLESGAVTDETQKAQLQALAALLGAGGRQSSDGEEASSGETSSGETSSGEASSASGGTVTSLGSMTIASDAEAAQFLQYLSGLGTDAQAISAALGQLDSAGLSCFHGYLEGVIAGTSDETQKQQLTALLAMVEQAQGSGGDPDPGESLTEDEIPAFLEKLAGMSESEAAQVLLGLDLDSLYLLRDYLESAVQQYEDGKSQLAQANWQLTEAKREYEEQKKEVDDAFAEADAQLADAKAQLDDAKQQLDDGWQEILDGEQELADAKAEIEENEQKLLDAKTEIEEGWQELLDGEAEIADGEQQIAENEQKLIDGRADLEEGRQELDDGWQEYEDGKQEAEQELADGWQEIMDGRDELASLERPEWYVLGRGTNVGYASFEGDCDRMESLSTVFPTMFFLVAALVALTTMTRMVDEERGVIGAYKALGYGRLRIASKYLIYAAVPSVLGSLFGIVLGNQTLPRICWSAYLMMYRGPDLLVVHQPVFNTIGCVASAACTLGATAFACRSELRETPASLLQPKAPKAGKRIFLEYIRPLWKRLRFTQKVTCRNLFLYKRRLFMTIVGIAGATGLLLTGFGIKDSVSGIVEKQYSEIYLYDTIVSLKDNEVSDGAREILDGDSFDGWMTVMKKSTDLMAGDASYSGYVLVPENAEDLGTYINLRDRKTGESVEFTEGSVLVTEKLAGLLGVDVGGTITIENESGRRVDFTVTGIVENYVYHYLYISPELYESEMNEPFEPSEIDAVCVETDGEARETIAAQLQEQEGVATAGFTEDTRASFDDLVESLNSIILVIIFCTGALAFVVLYNLTNINVTERQRELATIKVLGFRDGEVAGYIYRETSLLTILGCAVGLVFGVLMHSFVIQTVEVDMVMFGRTVEPLSFVYSALLTLLFAVIVDLVMYPKLKKIDMVESLKSVD